jgi:hypothetical protein
MSQKIDVSKNDLEFFLRIGCSEKELLEVFSCSKTVIHDRKRKYGLTAVTADNNPNFKPIDKNDLKFFIELGCTNEELGYVFYCSKRTIARYKKIMGLRGITPHNKTPEIIDGEMACIHCSVKKPLNEFNKLTSAKVGYRTICRDCDKARNRQHFSENPKMYLARGAKRRAQLLLRIPKWANTLAIKEFYKNCPEGYHVDHIVPLQGKEVSGFHVLNNLQYLPALENMSKGNKLLEEYL